MTTCNYTLLPISTLIQATRKSVFPSPGWQPKFSAFLFYADLSFSKTPRKRTTKKIFDLSKFIPLIMRWPTFIHRMQDKKHGRFLRRLYLELFVFFLSFPFSDIVGTLQALFICCIATLIFENTLLLIQCSKFYSCDGFVVVVREDD